MKIKFINTIFTAAILMFIGITTVSAQLQYRRAMDFDGDGKADFGISRRPGDVTSGQMLHYVRRSSNNSLQYVPWGYTDNTTLADGQRDFSMHGDFDGDGRGDFAILRLGQAANFTWYIYNAQTNTYRTAVFGYGEDRVVTGDYDGDGKTDIAVARPDFDGRYSAVFYWIRSIDGQLGYKTVVSTSGLNCRPLPGDFDGDGKADATIRCITPDNRAVWSIQQSSNNQTREVFWGLSGDKTQVGDYDGDGISDLTAIRTNPNGALIWYILQSTNGQLRAVQWGTNNSGHIPVAADYDGDNKTDIAIWNPQDGVFWVIRSLDNQVQNVQWGGGGFDRPMQFLDYQFKFRD